MEVVIGVVALLLGVAGGVAAGFVLARRAIAHKAATDAAAAGRVLEDARREATTIRKEAEIAAKEQSVTIRTDVERELGERRLELAKSEERLAVRAGQVEEREQETKRREQAFAEQEASLAARLAAVETLHAAREDALERVSGLTATQAKELLLREVEERSRHDMARRIRIIEDEARQESDRRVRNIISIGIQRTAASHAAETTVSMVELPSDDMKGRIIGREGRNIRALENLTGVDVIIDDTPQAVVLSGFDGVRRAIAKLTVSKLVADGRIHPARIEEAYYQAKAEIEEEIVRHGEQASFEADVPGLHPELLKILGRLRYRTSYGQNVLRHSLECTHIATIMASELGASLKTTRRAALLHDIGKAVTHEVEGSHAVIGAQLARKYGESNAVAHAIEAHHFDVEPQTVEAVLVQAADAISAARPGARGESMEHYAKRLAALEQIATSKPGVERCYAMQAGREVRVMVKPTEIDDDAAVLLSHQIAREIEDSLEYPGQIKITVIRESRSTEYAK
jgi:ribonuclease Y